MWMVTILKIISKFNMSSIKMPAYSLIVYQLTKYLKTNLNKCEKIARNNLNMT